MLRKLLRRPPRTTGPKGRRAFRLLVASLVVLIVVFAGLIQFVYVVDDYGREVSIDRILAFTASDSKEKIIWAELRDEDAQVVGETCDGSGMQGPITDARQCTGTVEKFHISYPQSDVATQELIERIGAPPPEGAGARVEVDKQPAKTIAKLLITFVFPLALLANVFGIIFLSRSADSMVADIAGFGRLGAKRQRKREVGTGVTFDDVAGAAEAIVELREVTDYLKNPERFQEYGAAPPRGVLLVGPPGCGKTLLARAVAGESNVPFLSISGAEFVESLVGVGAARVRDLFRQVRAVAPAIVFIDEIDAAGRRREGEGVSGGEREQTVNQLLIEIDGFDATSGVVVMGATNRPDILDHALLRPGRFDRRVALEAPDLLGREEILRLHARGKPISEEVDFALLARRTPGFTGADLANVINEAALLTLREGEGTQITTAHLHEAVQRILHGPQRRGTLMSPEERRRISFHESGHAVVTAAFGCRDQIHRVSVVARGQSLAQSVVSDEGERTLLTTSEIQGQLAMAMGGIAAEMMLFGESSTTAEDDISKATELAREMVGRYGMSTVMGRLRLLAPQHDAYLGGDGAAAPESVSSETLREFDLEVKRLVSGAEATASEVLARNRGVLERMAVELQAHETLEGSALDEVLASVPVETRPLRDLPPVISSTAGGSTRQ